MLALQDVSTRRTLLNSCFHSSPRSSPSPIPNTPRRGSGGAMRRIACSCLVVLLAVLTRFLPHIPNFSPVLGALLFTGALVKRHHAIWYPLAILAASDVLMTTVVYRMRIGSGQSITWLGYAV